MRYGNGVLPDEPDPMADLPWKDALDMAPILPGSKGWNACVRDQLLNYYDGGGPTTCGSLAVFRQRNRLFAARILATAELPYECRLEHSEPPRHTNVDDARRQARAFLSATTDTVLAFWRDMPSDWTPASNLGASPQRTNSILRTLEAVGAIERQRDGKYALYRPTQEILVNQIRVDRRRTTDPEASP